MNRLLIFVVVLIPFLGFCQHSLTADVPKYNQKSFLKFDFLSVEISDNEPDMGLAGIHYNLNINKSIYLGAGLYGAVTGIRGGFFR